MASAFQTLLAQQSEDSLRRMKAQLATSRERAEAELQGIAYEEQQVDQAIAKLSRRGGSSRSGSSNGTRLSADIVLGVVNRNIEGHFNSSHVVAAFADEGVQTNGEAVRQHLRRLANDHKILRDGKGFRPLARTDALSGASAPASPNGHQPDGENRELGLELGSQGGPG